MGAADRLCDRSLTEPPTSRLAPDHPLRREILDRHEAALLAGHPTYLDPASGYAVFTSRYLADRGHCCGSACRHCPYVDDAPSTAGAPP